MKPYPEPVLVKFGRISTLNFSKLTENFMFVSSFRMRKSCPPCPSLPTFKNKFFSQRLRKPPVHVVLVVQLGHYIKSKCCSIVFIKTEKSTRPRRPGRPTWPLFQIKIKTCWLFQWVWENHLSTSSWSSNLATI
jgi:hypothetical protein